jgi:hypothetical protein
VAAGWLYNKAVGRCAVELQLAFRKAVLVNYELGIACKATEGKLYPKMAFIANVFFFVENKESYTNASFIWYQSH